MKAVFDKFWGGMDIHRNNAFSSVAMEAAYREGEEWLEQLLPYISANFDYVCDYCAKNIPQIKPNCPDATYLMWLDCRALGMSNEELRDFFIVHSYKHYPLLRKCPRNGAGRAGAFSVKNIPKEQDYA